ncbi:MAG TPA: UTP--glucose-1-phosphate uridylyltransferase [Solirubrobacteraceae bacterium]|nr:UTP--glucose-1-phosphate uridylyltransferase [Solirubrobacteraceae bacterium]
MTTHPGLAAAEEKMRRAGLSASAIAAFKGNFELLVSGAQTLVASDELEPARDVPELGELPEPDAAGRAALDRLALIKLNGGLATSMGLRHAKSLVPVRDGRSFLDLIVAQTLALRACHGARLPLLLMDSDNTHAEALQALARTPQIASDVPPDFVQHRAPKIGAEDLLPVSWPADSALEWCPPGHGDVYPALRGSGALATLLEHGYQYAMISNADNLGAVVEPRILAFMARERIPFLMEAVLGTEADRKGGHLARRRRDGQLVLRETAQTPPEDLDSFTDFRRWRYYNTNSLWVDLRVLSQTLDEHGGILPLPLIVNRKTVDSRDPSSPKVLQLETAMGAAVEVFPGARVLCVPRTRFAPVKTTDDLIVVRSDAYALDEQWRLLPATRPLPVVDLDPDHYKLLDEFERHFPAGAPSLRGAEHLRVHGPVTFGAGVRVRGRVVLDNAGTEAVRLADGTELQDCDRRWPEAPPAR